MEEIGRHQRARCSGTVGTSVQQTKTAPDSSLKLDTPLVVKAWVGYSFGDTVLLCKWQAGERRKRGGGSDDGHLKNNVCVPLARSELRRISRRFRRKGGKVR